MAKEVENITKTRMVNRHDVAEYEQEGWKFVRNAGTQSAIMQKVEKAQAPVVASVKVESHKAKEKA